MVQRTIWIDMDNPPHVLLFKPVIKRLKAMGHSVIVTARDHGFACELLTSEGIEFMKIGRHYGKHTIWKILGTLIRVVQLLWFSLEKNIDIGLNHGSRSFILACYLRRIPCVTMFDYEFVFTDLFTKYSAKVLVPDLVPDEAFDKRLLRNSRLVKFPGIKEQLYATDFVPNDRVLDELRLDRGSVIVVLRPPATVAHYHVEASERLFDDSIEWLEGKENIITVVLPRTKHQYESLAKSLHGKSNFRLLAKPINGLSLLYHSDIVISGGGTMNREAAVLGLPVFSIFLGKEGAVDKYLSSKGLLTFVKSKEDLMKIEIRKRESKKESHEVSKSIGSGSEALMNFIINEIVSTVRK